jgi:hypothetical protein
MTDLEGRTTDIGTLFSQESFFRIPEYQRPFSWEDDNFEDLIDDILAADPSQEYFLGTLVLQKIDTKGNYEVVDGQQRLTSLMILLACLRDRLADTQYSDAIQDKILQKENVVDGIPQKVRLEVKDRKIFTEVVVTKGGTTKKRREKDLPEPEWRYVQAVNIFNERLSSLNENDLQKTSTFVSQKCVVIHLATSTFDDAFRLFTIVNDRGKQLRRIDVLKSINIAPDILSSQAVRNRIAQKWEELETDVGEAAFESIFHLIRLIMLKDKPQGDLLKEFENRVFTKGLVSKGEPFVDLVFGYVDVYKRVFGDRDILLEDDSNHIRFRELIHIMISHFKASEWKACLLFFTKKFHGEKVYEFCLEIEKVYLAQWVQGVRKDERYSAYAKILGSIETSKSAEAVVKGITYDDTVIEKAVTNPNIYGAGYCKYFLLRLELLATEHDVVKEFNAKSIEHVLPQTPDSASNWASIHDLSEINEYVNSIGNLVLLSKSRNSSASNYDFEIKKDKYLRTRVTDYPRSVEVLKYDRWDKATITERTEQAKGMFLSDP